LNAKAIRVKLIDYIDFSKIVVLRTTVENGKCKKKYKKNHALIFFL